MKDVLVTGAYGGMGRETVRLLSSEGYRVFALDVGVGAPLGERDTHKGRYYVRKKRERSAVNGGRVY